MSILIDKNTKLLVQGITGSQGMLHTKGCIDYGTNVVAGVTPGKGGQEFEGVPIFNSVSEAVRETDANASMILVPPAFTADAIMEAAAAEIPLIVSITEGVPVVDMVIVISSSATIELVAVKVSEDPAFSAMLVAEVANVTVGALSFSFIVIVTD